MIVRFLLPWIILISILGISGSINNGTWRAWLLTMAIMTIIVTPFAIIIARINYKKEKEKHERLVKEYIERQKLLKKDLDF